MAENYRNRSFLPLFLGLQQFDDEDLELLAAAAVTPLPTTSSRERSPIERNMMLSLLPVVLTIAVFAYVGRSSVPALERLPVTTWGVKDLFRNVRRGLDLCSARTPIGRVMDGPTNKTLID